MKKHTRLCLFLVTVLCLLAGAAMATAVENPPPCTICHLTDNMVFDYMESDNYDHMNQSQSCAWKCYNTHTNAATPYWTYIYHKANETCPYCGTLFTPCKAGDYTVVQLSPTCVDNGHKAYYKCNGCGSAFSDSSMESGGMYDCKIYNLAEWKAGDGFLAATGIHETEPVTGQAADCENAGFKDYYQCKVCNKAFTDADGKAEINFSTWSAEGGDGYIAPLGHSFSKPTYTWNGDQCTAEHACERTGCTEKETETAGEYVKDTDATCTAAETGHYEAAFTNTAFEAQKTDAGSATVGDPLGH
ncbi:MAG: hypothetical protein MJ142_05770, partial [Clostridia bacterium]|nr:hypothetical protein [Clostridia bacterium]